MPKLKYKEFEEILRNVSFFNFKSVEARLGKKYAKLFIHNLKKKGEIEELIKGWYSFKPSPYLILLIMREGYIGLGSAAFIHKAWNQITNLEILTPLAYKKLRGGERVVAGRKVIIKWLPQKMYFGYEIKLFDNRYIRVSDTEKTFIDLIYFGYPFKDEILPQLIKKIDKQKLLSYLELLRKRKLKRLSRFLSSLNKEFPDLFS